MQLTNEWIERGKTEGRSEGRRDLLSRQLRRRVGEVPHDTLDRINQLSDSQLDEFGEALLDFHGVADIQLWFDHWHGPQTALTVQKDAAIPPHHNGWLGVATNDLVTFTYVQVKIKN